MATADNLLKPLCEDPPVDLVHYFDKSPIADYSDPRVGLLPLTDAIAVSADFRTFHPLAVAFGLVVLDDANTSNHHCYVTRGPLAGSILYLVHDDDSTVVFKGLDSYLRAAKSALDAGTCLDDLYHDDDHPKVPVTAPDQDALAKTIRELLRDEGDETAVAQLVVYVPAMDLSKTALLATLARHSDMYVVEAVGNAIARLPRPELMAIAVMVSEHKHSQVANAGKRAIAAIEVEAEATRDRGGI
jgi:hypothetical protein